MLVYMLYTPGHGEGGGEISEDKIFQSSYALLKWEWLLNDQMYASVSRSVTATELTQKDNDFYVRQLVVNAASHWLNPVCWVSLDETFKIIWLIWTSWAE